VNGKASTSVLHLIILSITIESCPTFYRPVEVDNWFGKEFLESGSMFYYLDL